MTVEEGEAGIVGDEIDFHFLVAADHHHVFQDAGKRDASVFGDCKAVTVQVDGMNVIAGVAHFNAVAAALAEVVFGGHLATGENLVVDGPEIEAVFGGILFGEGHLDGFVGRRGLGSGMRAGKTRVVPMEGRGSEPLRLSLVSSVFNNDAYAVFAVVVGKIAENPHAGVVHFDDGGNAFGGPEPKGGDHSGSSHWIAVERQNSEAVAGKSEAANLRGAAIENVKEHPFAWLYANGFAVTEHATIDGEIAIADFVAVRHAVGEGGFHGGFAGLVQLLVGSSGSEKILWHVAALAERRFKFLEGQENLAVVTAGIVGWFDVRGTNLAAVLSGVQVGASAIVGVIEAQPGRFWRERDDARPAGGNVWRAFFGGAIHIGRDKLAVPVELLGCVGVVVNFDRDRLAFLEPQERARELAVVGDGGNDAVFGDFDGAGLDAQGVVGRRLRVRRKGFHQPWCW